MTHEVLIRVYRLLIVLLSLASILIVTDVWILGKRIHGDSRQIPQHRARAFQLLINTLLTIIVVEVLGRDTLHAVHHPFVFWIHLIVFALPFLALLCFILVITGLKNPSMHGKIAPWCYLCCIGTNLLGTYLVFLS